MKNHNYRLKQIIFCSSSSEESVNFATCTQDQIVISYNKVMRKIEISNTSAQFKCSTVGSKCFSFAKSRFAIGTAWLSVFV